MNTFRTALLVPVVLVALVVTPLRADEITDWNQTLFRAALVAGTTPLAITRVAAIVQAAVFDAVNGIEHRYRPIHVTAAGPAGASRDAAAVGAAYATLVALYPTQKSTFDGRLAISLAEIGTHESSGAVTSGLLWGQQVAGLILTWRSTDGVAPAPPPFLGGTAVGQWRPTPPGFGPGASPQYATMTPWVLDVPWQFRPTGPPLLGSERYAAEFNETKTMGSILSVTRTPDQTVASWFWAAGTASQIWNGTAVSLIEYSRGESDHGDRDRNDRRPSSTLENARLFARLNLAIADAAIGCWDAKYTYAFWRPVTAIPLAASDGNAATVEDPAWTPLLGTPAHPEYPSGHSCFSGAAAGVLAAYFGERTRFRAGSDLLPGIARSFRSFSAALEEVENARIFAGIHFRSATHDGQTLGTAVAEYVMENAMQPLRGRDR
jgi:membrane-associated phospholipid phosphatase